jgi:hypothetical protein
MDLRKIIKEHLILERKIATIKANLTINYDLKHDSGGHSEKRKWRHVSDGGERIYDYYIEKLIENAKDEITFNIVNEQILDSVRFIVSETKSPFLNVIIDPKMKNPYDWNLTVVTVMNKESCRIGRGQLQIFV